jgi:hypothetical protein
MEARKKRRGKKRPRGAEPPRISSSSIRTTLQRQPDVVRAGLIGRVPGVRSRCRLRDRGAEYFSESGIKRMSGRTKLRWSPAARQRSSIATAIVSFQGSTNVAWEPKVEPPPGPTCRIVAPHHRSPTAHQIRYEVRWRSVSGKTFRPIRFGGALFLERHLDRSPGAPRGCRGRSTVCDWCRRPPPTRRQRAWPRSQPSLAVGDDVIKCPSSLNVIKDTDDRSCH